MTRKELRKFITEFMAEFDKDGSGLEKKDYHVLSTKLHD